MRVTTLKAAKGRLGGLLAYYAGLAEDRSRSGPARGPVDYYLDPSEPPGRWWGHGRDGLGLDGEVTGEQLRAVLEGRHPVTGRPLGRRFGDASARGFDATFSAPKSVSVLWAVCPDAWVRAEVLAAHDAAVDAALGFLESHGAVTRRGKDGVAQVDTKGLTVGVFRQHTSRSMDPQLHTHAVIAGKVQDTTGRWLSLDARFLKRQQRTIGWVFGAALRTELTSRLGVEWGPMVGGHADIVGLPRPVLDAFSKRTAQIDIALDGLIRAWSAEHDGTEPDPRTIATLERRAVLASRPGKTHGIDATTLHDQWEGEAKAVGFDPDRTLAVLDGPAPVARMTDEQIVAEAISGCEEEASTWLEADLARHVATLLSPTDPTAADAIARIDRLAASAAGRCVELTPEAPVFEQVRHDGRPVTEAVTDRHMTTQRVLAQETDLQHWAANAITRVPVDRADPQGEAVRAIAGRDQLVLVVGPAGTGKTTTTARAVRALQDARRPVVALAPSGKAADVLGREAGCETTTLAGFLTAHHHRQSPWPTGTTVIVDEAAMAATDDLHHLAALAHTHQWRIVAVGDPHQLPAVGRGGVFAHWIDTLPHHHLDTPRRFTEAWEAGASLALRAGDPGAADHYDEHGRLDTIHPALLPERVAIQHRAHTDRGRTVAITTSTADTARRINQAIQSDRSRGRWRRPTVLLDDGTRVGVGDRIATRHNHPDLRTDSGERVRNRHTWDVTDIHANGDITATHDSRGTVRLPGSYVARHVELGWAVTGYGTQGDTVDVGVAVLEAGTSRNGAYVALTRGRHSNSALIVDPTGLAHPRSALADVLSRTPARSSALAMLHRLRPGTELTAPVRSLQGHEQATEPHPLGVTPGDPTTRARDRETQDKVDKIQARLDRLQETRRQHGRGIDLGH